MSKSRSRTSQKHRMSNTSEHVLNMGQATFDREFDNAIEKQDRTTAVKTNRRIRRLMDQRKKKRNEQ